MKGFDKVGAYAAVVTMIAAGGISARAQTNHFDTPGGITVLASTVPANEYEGGMMTGRMIAKFYPNAHLE
jgi:hypothetical protein